MHRTTSERMSGRIWITWEEHRRSRILAEHFNAALYEVQSSRSGIWRYLESSLETYRIIKRNRPKLLISQNPSMILALLTVLLKPWFRYKLVIDRHTNFKFKHRHSFNPKWILFRCVSHYTIRHSDITIVTNKGLRRIVSSLGGNAYVLPDKLPTFNAVRDMQRANSKRKKILFVCSFSDDEPIDELLDAFYNFDESVDLYISGNWKKKYDDQEITSLPPNVVLTGFVTESDFITLMAESDGVIVLTKNEFTLNCGAYEALSLNKPLLLSKTITLRSYFKDLAVYTDTNSCRDLRAGLQQLKDHMNVDPQQLQTAVKKLDVAWHADARELDILFSRELS